MRGRYIFLFIALFGGCASFVAKAESKPSVEYKLRFVEDFKGNKLNTKLWERISSGSPDWCKNMSLREDLVSVGDGILTLYGIKNDGRDPSDKRPVLTGGIMTKDL